MKKHLINKAIGTMADIVTVVCSRIRDKGLVIWVNAIYAVKKR